MADLNCPQERGQEYEGMIQEPIVSASIHCVVQDCLSHPSTHPATFGNLLYQLPGLPLFGFPSCEDISHGSRLAPRASGSTKIPRPSAWSKSSLLMCTMRIHSETLRRTRPTKPTVRETLPQRVRYLIWNSGCNVHSRCCVHDVQNGQRLPTSRSSHPLRQRHLTISA